MSTKQEVIRNAVIYYNASRKRNSFLWQVEMMGDTDRYHDPATRERKGQELASFQSIADSEQQKRQEVYDKIVCPECGNHLVADNSFSLICTNIHNHKTNHYITIATHQELLDAGLEM